MTLKHSCVNIGRLEPTDKSGLSGQPVQVFPTCKNFLIPLFQLIPVKGFTHLRDDFSADVCGKGVCLWWVREIADPATK